MFACGCSHAPLRGLDGASTTNLRLMQTEGRRHRSGTRSLRGHACGGFPDQLVSVAAHVANRVGVPRR